MNDVIFRSGKRPEVVLVSAANAAASTTRSIRKWPGTSSRLGSRITFRNVQLCIVRQKKLNVNDVIRRSDGGPEVEKNTDVKAAPSTTRLIRIWLGTSFRLATESRL